MAVGHAGIWELIDRCESYLVSCMFEEAASLASSLLKRICDDESSADIGKSELLDMKEAAGMVLVQSLKELRRTAEIMIELKQLFHSVTAIPIDVLLTGACIQMPEAPTDVQTFLEEFLSKWRCVDEEYYVLVHEEENKAYIEECDGDSVLAVDKYLEVVEVYAVRLLGKILIDLDLAISWVEKAALPEERRQELLRRLDSLDALKSTNSAQGSYLLADEHEAHFLSEKNVHLSDGSPEALKSQGATNRENVPEQAVLKLYRRVEPCFWWFRTITFKFGSTRLVICNGKIMLGCLILIIFYIIRRKQVTLKRIATRQVMAMKKALIDLWQLAFSYQVNPLAAVQPLPAATARGSQ